MPLSPSVRFLPYLLDLVTSAALKEIGIPVEKINHLPCLALNVFLDGFLLFHGAEVIIRKEEKEPNSRLQARDARLRLHALQSLLDELFEPSDILRIVMLDPDDLTQKVDVEYLLLGCLFFQNGSPLLLDVAGRISRILVVF